MSEFDDVMAHFGVKGMRWGVRRKHPSVDARSEDAKIADTAREKAKKGGTKALSNQELQVLVTRMNLEQQLARLVSSEGTSKIAKGKKVVQGIISTGRTINDVVSFVNSPAGKLVKEAIKNS